MSALLPGAGKEATTQVVATALAEFSKMLPTLSGYARVMTGNSTVYVEPGPSTRTDGRRIMIRPPLALAERVRHDRALCGLRGEMGILRCPACAAREDILAKMRHEIGHIAHGSFQVFPVQPKAMDKIIAEARLPEHVWPKKGRGTRRSLTLLEWANLSPDKNIGTLALVLEDVRIDRRNAERSVGGAAIYRTFLERTLATGVDGSGPVITRDHTTQVLLGMLSMPHGVDVTGLISTEAQEVVAQVQDLMLEPSLGSRDLLRRTLLLYRRLIDLGVFPEPEPEQEQEQGEQEQGEGESEQAEGDSGEDQSEGGSSGGDEDPGTSPGEEAEAGEPDEVDPADLRRLVESATGHDGSLDGDFDGADPELPERIEECQSQVVHLGTASEHLEGIRIFGRARADGRGPLEGASRDQRTLSAQDPPESVVGALVGRARVVFSDNVTVKRQRNATRGRVSPTVLGKRAWNPEDQRLFERRQRPDTPSYSVLIGMDNSGSTASERIAQTLRETTLAAAVMCQRVGVEVSVFAHTTGSGRYAHLYEIKGPDDPWTPQIGDDLRRLKIGMTNFDGSTMRAYRRILAPRSASRKVLLYFTDGYIPGTGGHHEESIMREEVALCRKQGITLLGVGAHTSSPEEYGIPTVRLDRVEDVKRVLEFLAKEFGV